MSRCILSIAVLLALTSSGLAEDRRVETEICVYGATPSGILAAVAAKRADREVVIVEPGRWVGGMLGAGLKPMQDCPNYAATGGMTRGLLKSLGQPQDGPQRSTADLSPDEIRKDFAVLLEQYEIPVYFEHRVAGCEKPEGTIHEARFDLAPFDELGCPVAEPQKVDNLRVTAKVFIDASYEGDLMAAADVSYRVGREAADEFDEESAGVRPPVLKTRIDPFRVPGKPESGLLPWVQDDHGKSVGAADRFTQAYNYRYYTTADVKHRVPITPPGNYDPGDYELVGRYVALLAEQNRDAAKLRRALVGIWPGWKNANDWNYQRNSLITMAPLGISQVYADGDAAAKAKVWKQHQDYLRGLYHFMRTDARVPESYRQEIAAIGLDGRFHSETGHWPHQLYIRVSRRLKAPYTITAHDVYNRTQVEDSIGLAQYGIDTYPARRIWGRDDAGYWVANEGNMFVGGSRGPTNVPYPIPYRAITPRSEECTNLLVPVCFSASHLGYASARMEPVFMITGESAGIAAVLALAENRDVQDIDMAAYLAALQEAGQKLNWDPRTDQAPGSTEALNFARLLRECDADGDKLVSRSEWNANKPAWKHLFSFIDKNEDGMLIAEEYEAFQEFKADNPDWEKKVSR